MGDRSDAMHRPATDRRVKRNATGRACHSIKCRASNWREAGPPAPTLTLLGSSLPPSAPALLPPPASSLRLGGSPARESTCPTLPHGSALSAPTALLSPLPAGAIRRPMPLGTFDKMQFKMLASLLILFDIFPLAPKLSLNRRGYLKPGHTTPEPWRDMLGRVPGGGATSPTGMRPSDTTWASARISVKPLASPLRPRAAQHDPHHGPAPRDPPNGARPGLICPARRSRSASADIAARGLAIIRSALLRRWNKRAIRAGSKPGKRDPQTIRDRSA